MRSCLADSTGGTLAPAAYYATGVAMLTGLEALD